MSNKTELCFAVPGADSIVDVIDPETGRSRCYGRTLDEVRAESPGAEIMTLDAHCAAKAARQDTPLAWVGTSEARYHEMLEVLPPAAQLGSAFLVGEPYDHHALTGRPRFSCFKREAGLYFRSSRPMAFAEFRLMFGGR